MNRLRRRLVLAAALGPAARGAAAAFEYAPALPRRLEFPRDHGAHPGFRTEWWYLTGHLDAAPGSQQPALGIQLTFFRIRPPIDSGNPSRFAAHQLLLAHAALADPRRGALLHEERIERAGLGIAEASAQDTGVEIDHWRLVRGPADGVYRARMRGAHFAFELTATPTQALMLQGDRGYSRKAPSDFTGAAASYYYSEPQLLLQARITVDAGVQSRSGRGWLDHEWSSTLLPPHAAGWDWAGFNLDDGSALTAFRIRRVAGDGDAPDWFAYASLRVPGRPVQTFASSQVRFEPVQSWTSPRTRARYPVAQRLTVGSRRFETRPMMPDQEFDALATSGIVYWEGASELLEGGRPIGRGYLELTGYAGPVPGALAGDGRAAPARSTARGSHPVLRVGSGHRTWLAPL